MSENFVSGYDVVLDSVPDGKGWPRDGANP
jgi:hypothetical protein